MQNKGKEQSFNKKTKTRVWVYRPKTRHFYNKTGD